jgi:hypothetical protein
MTARLIQENCSPVASDSQGSWCFNSRQPNGLWDVFIQPFEDNEAIRPLPEHDGHRGGSDMTDRLLLLTTAFGPLRKDVSADPGKGFGNDLQLVDRATGRVSRLTHGRKGIIWAKLRPDGKKVCWSEMRLAPLESNLWHHLLGVWRLHVADIAVSGDTYWLENERTWEHPTEQGFIETYGWVPGTDRIIFASDSGARGSFMWWLGAQLWTIPDTLPAGTDARVRVSRTFPAWWGGQENVYHEFAHFAPGDDRVYTSIIRDTKDNGMDLWRMRLDGSGRERVSFFGGVNKDWKWMPVDGYPAPRYIVVGGMAWVDGAWVAGIAADANAQRIDAWRIEI